MQNSVIKKRIKMLTVHNSLLTGGAEKSFISFLNLFPKERYDIDLALISYAQDEARLMDMVPKHVRILPELKQFQKWSPELIEDLRKSGMNKEADIRTFIRNRNESEEFKNLPKAYRFTENWKLLKDICPVYEGYDIAVAATRELPLKIVATGTPGTKRIAFVRLDFISMIEMGIYDKQYLQSQQVYYEEMDKIICLSSQNAESFCILYPKLSDRVCILPHIRNKEEIIRQANEYYPPEYEKGAFNVLTVARISGQKGIELLINIANCLKRHINNFRWFIIGRDDGGEYSERCHSLLSSLNLNKNVSILKERANIYPYFKHCDLYVHTSLYEGRCGAIEEAMILNCPIVTTSFASVVNQIRNGENGIVCPIEPESIAQAIYDLYCDENKREKIADGNKSYLGNTNVEEYISHFNIT